VHRCVAGDVAGDSDPVLEPRPLAPPRKRPSAGRPNPSPRHARNRVGLTPLRRQTWAFLTHAAEAISSALERVLALRGTHNRLSGVAMGARIPWGLGRESGNWSTGPHL